MRMLTPGASYSESYPATAESVPRARGALTAFAKDAGAGPDRLHAIRLAASEAVTNAVRHAYRDRTPGLIQVSASCVGGDLWLLIADSGSGLRAQSKAPGLGLGLALIAQLADDFQIHSRGTGGTELQMRFKLHSAEPESAKPAVQLLGSFSTAAAPA